MPYLLRRVSTSSALLYGLLLGLLLWLIPGVLLGWLARSLVLWLFSWLGGLQVAVPMPLGEEITIDLGAPLGLDAAQAQLAALASQDTALAVAVTLATVAAGMLLTGLIAALAALLYNLFAGIFGGVQLTLDPLGSSPVVAMGGTAAARRVGRPAVLAANVDEPTAVYRPPAAAASRPPTAWLVAANKSGVRWPLATGVTRVGSAPANDIVLPGVAPQHAEIRFEAGHYVVYDLGSRQTWVNSVQVATTHLIKNGFRIQFGQTELVAQILAASSG